MLSILGGALALGAQQLGQWLQSPAGRKALQTYGPFALAEIAKKLGLDK